MVGTGITSCGRSGCGCGRCCSGLRYATCAYDSSMYQRIMVRFRPIVPRPDATGSFPGRTTPGNSNRRARAKRKYVRLNKSMDKTAAVSEIKIAEDQKPRNPVVTLSLLPETPETLAAVTTVAVVPAEPSDLKETSDQVVELKPIAYPCFNSGSDLMVGMSLCVVIVVVGVMTTDTCVDVDGLGSTDKERKMNLEKDTCPGFISDGGCGKVIWRNKAFDEMMVGQEIWLVNRESFPVMLKSVFGCRVRLEYMCEKKKEKKSMIVPCDVWRMDGGDLAWRLDVQAALTLGRLTI